MTDTASPATSTRRTAAPAAPDATTNGAHALLQFQRGDRGKQHVQPDRGNQNRLSEEQRRELNRDLDRANREIYRR